MLVAYPWSKEQSLAETLGLGNRMIHVSHYIMGIMASLNSLSFDPYVWQVTLFNLE